MTKMKIGSITEDEKIEIKNLYERKVALSELILSINSTLLNEEEKNYLYEKIVNDMGNVKSQYDNWWIQKSSKYQWNSIKNGSWSVDFNTNDIYVISDL